MFARPFNQVCRTLVIALAALAIPATSASAAVIYGDVADGERKGDTGFGYTNSGGTTLRVGRGNGNASEQRNASFVFDLSGVTDPIEEATLSLFLESKDTTATINYAADLYGVGYAAADTGWPTSASHFYAGALDSTAGVVLLKDNFAISTSTAGTYLTLSGPDLVDYLNARPESADFVLFRLNPDVGPNKNSGYLFSSADSTVTTQHPNLDITTVPEPTTLGLAALGGLMMLRRRH